MYPADVVLFEGILAFYSQEVRDLFRMKLFVDTDADTRLSRRGRDRNPPHLIRAGDSDQSRAGAGTKLQRAGEFFSAVQSVTRAARGSRESALLRVSRDSVGFLLPWLGFLL